MAGTSTTGASRNGHSGDSERVRGALGGDGELVALSQHERTD
jgi:hypothetical protein